MVDPQSLLKSGRKWLERTLKEWAAGETAATLMCAGVALEHLCKAHLCALSPALLVEARVDFDSLLRLTGNEKYASSTRTLRTASASVVLKRAQQTLPALAALPAKPLAELLEVRNGELHVGVSEAKEQQLLLAAGLRAAEVLLGALGVQPQDVWGQYADAVQKLLDDRTRAVELVVAQKLTVAREAYNSLLQSLPAGALAEQVLIARERGSFFIGEHEESVGCPACSRQAETTGSKEVEWGAWDNGYGLATYTPFALMCGVCGLELESTEQLVAAGLRPEWELDDPEEPDWEPDEDYFRDR